MLIFATFLGPVAKGELGGPPYPLYVFAGLLPWTFFAGAVTAAGQSVVGSQNLVTKVYFPRLIIPLSAVGAPLVDFAVAFAMLLLLMLGYGVVPGWGMLLVPPLLAALTVAAVGVGALLAALTVAYRDFRYVVPFLTQLWMFATPVIYLRAEAIGSRLQGVMPLNPAYGLIAGFRGAVLGGVDWWPVAVSAVVGLALLLGGVAYFRRVESRFSDVI
jgi:lipopolysaccharide transport system permease protein